MLSPNNHILKYLRYYSELENSPGFAVLLSGEWGCGKTWLFEDFKKKYTTHNFLYVSLYGITNLKEIEHLFFTQLHPVLSSKKFLLAGSIGNNLLKGTLRIDVNNDKKDDININPTIPGISLSSLMTNTEGYILVFDDIERTKISINEVLGYINSYIEHKEYKVILIANEDEILKKEPNYKDIKEKLIGKTFKVHSEFEKALIYFLDDPSLKSATELYKKNIKLISQLFYESRYNNLRFLKQTLLDFDRFHDLLDSEVRKNIEAILHIFKFFFILSFESKKGKLTDEDYKVDFMESYLARQDNKEINIEKIAKKYSEFQIHDSIIGLPNWRKIIEKSIIEEEMLNKNIKTSRFFSDLNTPTWKKLWHSFDLDKHEFDDHISSLYNDLKKSKILEPGEILQTASILLWFSKNKFIKYNTTQIITIMKNYIKHLFDNDKLEPLLKRSTWDYAESWDGLGFHSKDFTEFKDIVGYLNNYREQKFLSSISDKVSELISDMKNDTQSFYDTLAYNNYETGKYQQTPILNHIEISDFISILFKLPMKQKKKVFYMFESRFKRNISDDYFIKEMEWFKTIFTTMNQNIDAQDEGLEKYQNNSLLEQYLKPIYLRLTQ